MSKPDVALRIGVSSIWYDECNGFLPCYNEISALVARIRCEDLRVFLLQEYDLDIEKLKNVWLSMYSQPVDNSLRAVYVTTLNTESGNHYDIDYSRLSTLITTNFGYSPFYLEVWYE